MSHRLQILLDSQLFKQVKKISQQEHKTISAWARDIIITKIGLAKKSERNIVSQLGQFNLPAPDINQILQEIEEGRK